MLNVPQALKCIQRNKSIIVNLTRHILANLFGNFNPSDTLSGGQGGVTGLATAYGLDDPEID